MRGDGRNRRCAHTDSHPPRAGAGEVPDRPGGHWLADPSQQVPVPVEARLIVRAPDGDEREVGPRARRRSHHDRAPRRRQRHRDEPDPQQLVTRQEHCALERDGSRWYIVDHGSVNGTYLRRADDLTRVQGRSELADGDTVCLVGMLSDDRDPETPVLCTHDELMKASGTTSLGTPAKNSTSSSGSSAGSSSRSAPRSSPDAGTSAACG